jgi:UDP-N-acetylglucosamine 2-epimerase (non-hydrolysing)
MTYIGIEPHNYFLVSSHRQENIDSPIRLAELINTLNTIADKYGKPVVVTTHPRLKSMMAKGSFTLNKLVTLITPVGFIDYCNLQINAKVDLSDSGSISEECALLNIKAITLRDSMERPEALESGTILMSGLDAGRVIAAIDLLQSYETQISIPEDYQITNTSERVVKFIQSTYHVRDFWSGRR